ncbi:MAG: four helix bundle protein [Candidatus Omnitrophica bacterium]|nr:four helix bundle protein [Candidatus Omnitrophota bacterium]
MAYKSFEDLEVWKRSRNVAIQVYKKLRNCHEYSLRDQMNRSAVSIASNIAEGAERDSKLEYRHYLHIAKGSAGELRTQLSIAQEIGIIKKDDAITFIAELKEISSMLHGLVKSLNNQLKT